MRTGNGTELQKLRTSWGSTFQSQMRRCLCEMLSFWALDAARTANVSCLFLQLWYTERGDLKCAADLHKTANENTSVGYTLHPYAVSGGDQGLYPHSSSAHHHGAAMFSALGGSSLGSLGGMGEMKSVMPQSGSILDGSSAGLAYQQGMLQRVHYPCLVRTPPPRACLFPHLFCRPTILSCRMSTQWKILATNHRVCVLQTWFQ